MNIINIYIKKAPLTLHQLNKYNWGRICCLCWSWSWLPQINQGQPTTPKHLAPKPVCARLPQTCPQTCPQTLPAIRDAGSPSPYWLFGEPVHMDLCLLLYFV